jgi:ubiquitin C-terminal hydrolase
MNADTNNRNLIEFKPNCLLYPFGFYNNSIICYFNSLIQVLLTCTSITDYLLNNKEKLTSNTFLSIYINIIEKYIIENHKSDFLVENLNLLLFNEFIKIIKQKNKQFGFDQEDSGELLILLLEIINDKYINNLFLHKYKCDIYCKYCKSISNINNDSNIFFDVNLQEINNNYLKFEIDKNLDNLNKFIRNNYSEILDYKCKKCNAKETIKINRLILVPTIIIINLNKYFNKYNYQYPIELYFINKQLKKKYKYKLISTINHSGNQNFGHYIAKTIRKNHKNENITDNIFDTYLFNDTSYQKDTFKSDSNSYLLFYHFIETIEFYD